MRSRTTSRFRALLEALPAQIRRQADEAYRRFSEDPSHPSLNFKKVGNRRPLYSARVNESYRVLGYMTDTGMLWIWIGSHTEYERMIGQP